MSAACAAGSSAVKSTAATVVFMKQAPLLRFVIQAVDIRDDISHRYVIGQHTRGRSHLCAGRVLGCEAALAGAEAGELRHEIPVALPGERRRLQRWVAFRMRSMAARARRIELATAFRIAADR